MDIVLKTLEIKFPLLVSGTVLTVVSSIICIILAMILAIPTGLGRLSNVTVIRSISTFYVETVRGTPLLFQLLVWFFGIQLVLVTLFNVNVDGMVYNLLTALNSNSLYPKGTSVSPLIFAIIGLSFNYGAYLAEVVRAGVQSVDQGQTEAALSLGLSRFQVARHVVLPQALRIMIPPLTNNFITLIQDTSFFLVIGVAELALVSQTGAQSTSSPLIRWTFYIVELAIYFVICYSLATVSRRAERRVAHTIAGAH
jgi:His/Glu/Gln/Arg/opine family amino acid ABC transporter permease subunit